MEPTIVTLATIPAVLALVTIAKDLGLPAKFSPALAVILGVALAVFDGLALGTLDSSQNILEHVSVGIILGLSASGVYDGAKMIGSRRPPQEE